MNLLCVRAHFIADLTMQAPVRRLTGLCSVQLHLLGMQGDDLERGDRDRCVGFIQRR